MAIWFGFSSFGILFLSLAVHLDNIFRPSPATEELEIYCLKEKKVRESCDHVLPGAET